MSSSLLGNFNNFNLYICIEFFINYLISFLRLIFFISDYLFITAFHFYFMDALISIMSLRILIIVILMLLFLHFVVFIYLFCCLFHGSGSLILFKDFIYF